MNSASLKLSLVFFLVAHLHLYSEAVRRHLFFASYGLAWSTTSGPVSPHLIVRPVFVFEPELSPRFSQF